MENREVIVIGAGPAGSIASSLLKRAGHDVVILERESFPRFSIGESLLPHCLDFVAEAGMIGAVDAAGFQLKNGAAFARGDDYADFDFGQQYSRGRATAFQVPRARFDQAAGRRGRTAGCRDSLPYRDRGCRFLIPTALRDHAGRSRQQRHA